MRKHLLLNLMFFLFFHDNALAQFNAFAYEFEGQAIGTTPHQVPFWLWANKGGSVPLPGVSFSLLNKIQKEYDSTGMSLLDWGLGFEARANTGSKTEFVLLQAYGKARIKMFEFKAGRVKEISGLVDSTLSTGAFSVSGNALGIPKVQLAIPEFYSLPIWGGILAFKGNFSHGWLGDISTPLEKSLIKEIETYFHQKSLYGRFGKPHWRLKLYGGFNHQAFWGHSKEVYGSAFALTDFQEFKYVVFGKAYGNNIVETSKIGNHLGSIDLGLEYDFGATKVFAYRQNIYDIGALYYLANILDGLNGLSFVNKKEPAGTVYWNKVLIEFLYTKNQAGQLWSRFTPSGNENYYNSYLYQGGWSYNGLGLGNPFLSTKNATRNSLVSEPDSYFNNNRVIAIHLGLEGKVKKWDIQSKASYSFNYGTYGTSPIGHSSANFRIPPLYGLFGQVNQFSAYLEGEREILNGSRAGFIAALDKGGLYSNSLGLSVKFSHSFK